MAIDTLTKRSAALRYARGRTRQPEVASSAFVRGAGLGLYAIVVATVTDGITTRLTLRGTAKTRLSVGGPSMERYTVEGPSEKRLTLRGSSEP